jgi:hypothetical protein
MKFTASNHSKKWVQMTPKSETRLNLLFSRHQVQGGEPAPFTQTANEINGFTGFRFKVQNGFKMGSMNPIRFIGSRPYIRA